MKEKIKINKIRDERGYVTSSHKIQTYSEIL